MNEEQFKKVLERLFTLYEVDNPTDLSRKMNIPVSTIYTWTKKRDIDLMRIMQINNKIDLNWLMGIEPVKNDVYVSTNPTQQYYKREIDNMEENLQQLKNSENSVEKSIQNEILILEAKIKTLKDFLKTYSEMK